MRECAVLNCANNSGQPFSVYNHKSYHRFPKDPETRQAWIYATGRLNWTPQQYSTICSQHFTEYDFTYKNGKKHIRSRTGPRFNLNEQNSRYTESQYHNETQAALEFLTGQMFPESEVPVQQETEVVTVQVIGGNNPSVVVKKPTTMPQNKPEETQEKKPRYFSIVNVFKSEAELKAEKNKINELIRDNVDPSISKILLSLNEPRVKKKKTKNGEKSSQNGSIKLPRATNGRFLKSAKKTCVQNTSSTSEGHYTDTLTREEIIHKLKQRDMKIGQQQHTIRELQKTHLRDKVLIESLQIKLKLKNNRTDENGHTLQYTQTDFLFKKPAQQQRGIQQQEIETINSENQDQSIDQNETYYDIYNRHSDIELKETAQQTFIQKRVEATNSKNHQSNRNFSNQVCFDTQNKHSEVELKKPAQQQLVKRKRERMKTTNVEYHNQSDRNFSDPNKSDFDTQNRQSDVGLKKPAQRTYKRKRVEASNSKNQSNRNFSDQEYFDTQNKHTKVGLKKPAQQQLVTRNQEKMETTNLEYHKKSDRNFSDQNQANFDIHNRQSYVGLKKPVHQTQNRKSVYMSLDDFLNKWPPATNSKNHQSNRNCSDQEYFDTQNRHSEVGLKKPAEQNNLVIQKTRNIETPKYRKPIST